MIKTDGIGCSIILRKTVNGIPITITKKLQKEIRKNLGKNINILKMLK
jgi:hypothetical protein